MNEKIKNYRLVVIKNYDNLMKKNPEWMKLNNKQKWKSIYKISKKIEKVNFDKKGEIIK
jgi:hypothetical protein